MKTYGLIGFPLSHSFSQKYFSEKFSKEKITGCEFINFPLENINGFPALLKENPYICGLSITIPYKQSIMNFLDELEDSAREVGAVNCIKREERSKGRWKLSGYNTDIFGFEQSLKPLLKEHHSHALVLGTGGAAKAVAYTLDRSNIKFSMVSRSTGHKPASAGILSYADVTAAVLSSSTLIINTTPLGMFPKVNACPDLPYQHLTPHHFLYDLTYNPEETLFLKKGKEKGAQIKNGLEMLHLQAEKAWEIWNSPT